MNVGHKFSAVVGALVAVFSITVSASLRAADPPEYSAPVTPFRIAGNVFYIGTKGLSAYLIVTPEGAILLDGTTAENVPLIERNITAVGIQLSDVKLLISDHAHYDHVAALAQIKRDTGARFLASAGDRWALEHGTPRGDTNYRPTSFPAIRVDGLVADGQIVRLGGTALTAHLTPGHTPGCTSWSMTVREDGQERRVLFLCSITVAGNTLVGNRAYPGIAADYRTTFAKLDRTRADILLTSHPEMADIIGKQARRNAGDRDAFVNPADLPRLVAYYRADFEAKLAQAAKASPRRGP